MACESWELRSEFGSAKSELRSEIRAVRHELRDEISAVRRKHFDFQAALLGWAMTAIVVASFAALIVVVAAKQ